MCVAGEEESGGASTGTDSGGSIPEILVTAPRIAIDTGALANVDWYEVAKVSGYLGLGGLATGGIYGALVGAISGGAAAAETQEGVDLEDLFVIENDMIVIPSVLGPYMSLH
jgi:hypothetical protein